MVAPVRRLACLLCGVLALAAAAPAAAVTVRLGPQDLVQSENTTTCGPTTRACTFVYGTLVLPGGVPPAVVQAPGDGVVTAWRVLATPEQGAEIRLTIARQNGNLWTAPQRSAPATAVNGEANTTNLPIQAGDRIGIETSGTIGAPRIAVTAAPGSLTPYFRPPLGATPVPPTLVLNDQNFQLNADVTLTPPVVASVSPASGPERDGPPVTITGEHLANARTVTFGGTAAVIVSNSNDAIVVRPPAAPAGAVDVVVTVPGGSATGRYRYGSESGGGDGPGPVASTLSLTRLAIDPGTVRPGKASVVTYRLDRAARVRFTVLRRTRAGLARVRGFTDRGAKGLNAQRLGARRLDAGRYVLRAQATDATGARSRTARVNFRVAR